MLASLVGGTTDMAVEGQWSLRRDVTEREEDSSSDNQWISYAVLTLGICTGIVRFNSLWTQCALGTNGSSSWFALQAFLLLGTEVCLLATTLLVALVVPPLIIMWTIALVFEFIFGHMIHRVAHSVSKDERKAIRHGFASKHKLLRSGSQIAREISALNSLNAVFITVCFVSMISLRSYVWSL